MEFKHEEYALFGPAGNSEDFYASGGKSVYHVPDWLKKHGLFAFEYQCGRGVKISDDSARDFGRLAAEGNIRLSVHAPYYISLSSVEEEKRNKSIDVYIADPERGELHGCGQDSGALGLLRKHNPP